MNPKDELIFLANHYGADPEYSRAGGGNASVKIDSTLWIKPSGVPLATLAAEDLVGLRTDVLLAALERPPAEDGDPVQAIGARALVVAPGGRRPSVELLFHALIPDRYVVHTHPLVANALTCNLDAEALATRYLGDEAIFVPYIDPGLPLADLIRTRRAEYEERTGRQAPGVTLLGNHGIIVSGNTIDEVTDRTTWLTKTIRAAIQASEPPEQVHVDPEWVNRIRAVISPTLRGLLGNRDRLPVVTSDASERVATMTAGRAGRALCAEGPLIPDQIVYAGSFPLVIDPGFEPDLVEGIREAVAEYRSIRHRDPVSVIVPGVMALGIGVDLATATNALTTLTDALKVAEGAEQIGQVRCMTQSERTFIENWEAESYRQKVASVPEQGRMAGRIALVTGAAQGFGLGIATHLLDEGAHVVLSDLNIDLAGRRATELGEQYGPYRVMAVQVDVSDPSSQKNQVDEVVATLGGVDLFVANAGVLKAEGVMTQPVEDFDLVTRVNYRGYFLGVRSVAPIMATQHRACPGAWFDIVEINSKSGLVGSGKNFAYAGSKFGGIGLTQSFALELVEHGTKVNAVCPGNYLDGPLWSDPERGLFVQYLKAGKVPGATTVEQVRRFYESKVPMARGCTPQDVARAVCYLVEQKYETGQALPVTGGQVMLG